ncbi:MAG: hypothetical protein JW808_10280, partial [Victivallales bacterium]|nr:hypothetical protein [Victivallales bacterium]
VHTRSCLCLPFRRGACRASASTLWAAGAAAGTVTGSSHCSRVVSPLNIAPVTISLADVVF